MIHLGITSSHAGCAQEVEAAWERRHHWGAPRISALLHEMSGFYVKSAQIMASKPDFLPSQVRRQYQLFMKLTRQ